MKYGVFAIFFSINAFASVSLKDYVCINGDANLPVVSETTIKNCSGKNVEVTEDVCIVPAGCIYKPEYKKMSDQEKQNFQNELFTPYSTLGKELMQATLTCKAKKDGSKETIFRDGKYVTVDRMVCPYAQDCKGDFTYRTRLTAYDLNATNSSGKPFQPSELPPAK